MPVHMPVHTHFCARTQPRTQVLTAVGIVSANQQSVLNCTVKDIGDGIFDSAVFLEENSFAIKNANLVQRMPNEQAITT